MRQPPLLLLSLMALCILSPVGQGHALADNRPAGSPGTATPQPYVQPQPVHAAGAPRTPPLLKQAPRRQDNAQDLQPARDKPLPLLEQQLQRNSRKKP